MFDIGFLEIIVILVITLLVIGPERMPEVARKIGQFVGKTRRFINSVKDNSEISETVRELQDSMNFEEEKRSLENVTGSLQEDLSQIQQQFEVDESISRPFGQDDAIATAGSQFNKAPTQPKRPEPSAVTEQEPQPDLATDPDNETSAPTATEKPVS
ncbi:twin-arginine translocase subunit TatB [Hydrogenovibrio sp. SC-1]|uniref:Sec-independent protein translocase protein TatB n=1 Tax=Hydrogenovibrio sp. SC-1 TaxID=2065820 RepID=UPI000C79DBBA|nr:Sec-independent protein translocase protein TatB [Hydrogenovibrio sp. SC-1]PLA74430.1 twin-arginine translocase subunit TatB [Hydrogenovibrio sp. SC-1]